jgi:hypothetical protein
MVKGTSCTSASISLLELSAYLTVVCWEDFGFLFDIDEYLLLVLCSLALTLVPDDYGQE